MNTSIAASQKLSLDRSLCRTCGHGYAELLVSGGHECSECHLERVADHAQAVEQTMGVSLGWSTIDHQSNREVFGYRDRPVLSLSPYKKW